MSIIDPGYARYVEDETRWTAGPKAWPAILVHSIRYTKRSGLPGRVREREAPREIQQGSLNECLATTVQAGICAFVILPASSLTYSTVSRKITDCVLVQRQTLWIGGPTPWGWGSGYGPIYICRQSYLIAFFVSGLVYRGA